MRILLRPLEFHNKDLNQSNHSYVLYLIIGVHHNVHDLVYQNKR